MVISTPSTSYPTRSSCGPSCLVNIYTTVRAHTRNLRSEISLSYISNARQPFRKVIVSAYKVKDGQMNRPYILDKKFLYRWQPTTDEIACDFLPAFGSDINIVVIMITALLFELRYATCVNVGK